MNDAEPDIEGRIERLEEIAERLEDGEVGLATAKELREEADEHLEALSEDLDVGEGDVIELEADVEGDVEGDGNDGTDGTERSESGERGGIGKR